MQAATGLADVHVAAFKVGRQSAAMLSAAPGVRVLPIARACVRWYAWGAPGPCPASPA